jgi:hypothetical protein
MNEELEAILSDFKTVDMDDPMNKSLAAGIALPFIKSLNVSDQVSYLKRLCELCKVDQGELQTKMKSF